MGFSFVSLAEIVYHCFLCIVLLFRKKRALFKKKQAQKTRRKNASILENSYQLDNPGKPFINFLNEKKIIHKRSRHLGQILFLFVFLSSRSLKTREKCISFAQFVYF